MGGHFHFQLRDNSSSIAAIKNNNEQTDVISSIAKKFHQYDRIGSDKDDGALSMLEKHAPKML